MCDAPWPYRSLIAETLRRALKVKLIDFLEPEERAWFSALPDAVPVWRGCQYGRERGLYWTTDRAVAEGFAQGKRCINQIPILVRAEIRKEHIFAVFLGRKESEIVVDPRRLRKIASIRLAAERAA
jgi:hypothetical protein